MGLFYFSRNPRFNTPAAERQGKSTHFQLNFWITQHVLSDGKTLVLPILFRIVCEPQISISFAQQKLPEVSNLVLFLLVPLLSFCGFVFSEPQLTNTRTRM